MLNGPVWRLVEPRVPATRLLLCTETNVIVDELKHDTNTLAFEGCARGSVEVNRASMNAAGQSSHAG
jgi:hypothetical protein